METTNVLMKNLYELQTLEFEEAVQPNSEERIAALRVEIPAPILAHYDRLGDRGKKGIALLQHQTCSGCHVSVPLGVVLELKRGDDIRCCENCGRYLYLQETAPAPEVSVKSPVKAPRLIRRKKLAPVG